MGKAPGRASEGLNRTAGSLLPSQADVYRLSIGRVANRFRAMFQSQYWGTNAAMRRLLTASIASVLVCGSANLAHTQGAPTNAPKPAKGAVKPEPKPAVPALGGAEPTLIGQYGTWGAYAATPNGKKVCFALAKPTSSKTNPPNRPRDPAYAFVSTRPAEKVSNEVSVMIGYTLKPGSESTVEVGGASYPMYTQGDGLWIKNAAEEERMVEAMRRSADLVVKGVSAKGTETTDTFSLKGLSQALDRIAQDCKR